jgi:hypothetical protein
MLWAQVTTDGSKHRNNAWAAEYTAFFPPDISLVTEAQHSANLSYAESSNCGGVNVVGALNYSGALSVEESEGDAGSASSSPSALQLQSLSSVQDTSSASALNTASFAPSPLPQQMHGSQHHHSAARPSVASTAASQSDAVNQGMLASNSYSMSVSSLPSVVPTGFSLVHPARLHLQRQFSDNSCNLSAITPAADGTTFNSSTDLPSLSVHQYSVSQICVQVGSSSDSLVSNVLDKAMMASYDQDISGEYLASGPGRTAASESTTSLSPYLRTHMSTRSNSALNFTPVVRANPIVPMFFPPAPPEVEAETVLPPSTDNTLSASQQFDHRLDAVFDVDDVSASVQSLPPPPPPPLEDPEDPTVSVAPAEGVTSTAERVKQLLLEQSRQQFDWLRTAPPTPSAAEASSLSTFFPANGVSVEPMSLPSPLSEVPRIASFGSVQSLSFLCSTDSTDIALCGGYGGVQFQNDADVSAHEECGDMSVEQQEPSRAYDVSVTQEEVSGDYGSDFEVEEGGDLAEDDEERDDSDSVNLVDDFESQSPVEDTVNLGDAYSDCEEAEGETVADDEYGEDGLVEAVEEVEPRCDALQPDDPTAALCDPELSEEDCSDVDADPSDLQLVNASIQSMNTSRLAASTGGSSVSCSYTSSMDELHSVNPQLKSAAWVYENYPHDSVSSGSAGIGCAHHSYTRSSEGTLHHTAGTDFQVRTQRPHACTQEVTLPQFLYRDPLPTGARLQRWRGRSATAVVGTALERRCSLQRRAARTPSPASCC